LNGNVCNTFKFKNQSKNNEKLADYFAVHFLMPENGVLKYIERIGRDNINVKKVIKTQQYFKVSFKAMLVRFKVLGLISNNQYKNMEETHLSTILPKLGYSTDLIKPTYDTYVPQNYIELITMNHDENKISYRSYKEYLSDVGMTIEDLEKEKEFDNIVEETSFDY
jgi:Zn-dependent peptidase ImmA (M78 family)